MNLRTYLMIKEAMNAGRQEVGDLANTVDFYSAGNGTPASKLQAARDAQFLADHLKKTQSGYADTAQRYADILGGPEKLNGTGGPVNLNGDPVRMAKVLEARRQLLQQQHPSQDAPIRIR